jgi:hypothetical protein
MTHTKLRAPDKRTPRRTDRSGTGAPRKSAGSHGSGSRQRSRGHSADPKASFERYIVLARSAALQGDVVGSEGHYQHAEHFFRLMKDLTA